MYCNNCNAEISADAKFCPSCGSAVTEQVNNDVNAEQQQAPFNSQPQYEQPQYNNQQPPFNNQYGQPQYNQPQYNNQQPPQYNNQYGQPMYGQPQYVDPNAKSAYLAGLLALFFGTFGVHNFYLGNTGKAIAQLLLTLLVGWVFGLGVIIAGIWSFIEGILLFTGSTKIDGHGLPLKQSF